MLESTDTSKYGHIMHTTPHIKQNSSATYLFLF